MCTSHSVLKWGYNEVTHSQIHRLGPLNNGYFGTLSEGTAVSNSWPRCDFHVYVSWTDGEEQRDVE